MESGDQTQGAMPDVFEFNPFFLAGLHRFFSDPFQCLDARHFVHADRVRIELSEQLMRFLRIFEQEL